MARHAGLLHQRFNLLSKHVGTGPAYEEHSLTHQATARGRGSFRAGRH